MEPSATVGEGRARDDAAVRALLERMARALTSGDARAVASLWAAPALIIGPDGTQAVGAIEELAEILGGAKDQYNARGVVDTRPDVVSLRWATDSIAIVEVRWPWLDEHRNEVGEEVSTYTITREGVEGLKLRVAVMHGGVTRH
jgi:uncharacterized protein (TIGR02246 family)